MRIHKRKCVVSVDGRTESRVTRSVFYLFHSDSIFYSQNQESKERQQAKQGSILAYFGDNRQKGENQMYQKV